MRSGGHAALIIPYPRYSHALYLDSSKNIHKKDYTHINFAGGRRVAWALYDAINRGAEEHRPFTPVTHDNIIGSGRISHLEKMLRQAARPRPLKP